ncbi:MAG: hypothetical protein WCX27_02990 [Candidatus Paceibacterota bacterium]|jgi:hypothetical protein
MILTPHSIVGATVANVFPEDPALGFALAFASHYFLDTLPHREYDIEHFFNANKTGFKNRGSVLKFFSSISLDLVVGVLIAMLFFVRDERSLLLTLLGIFAGLLPDFFQFMYLKFKNQPWAFFQKIHNAFHHPDKMLDRSIIGTLTQIVTAGLFLMFYLILK